MEEQKQVEFSYLKVKGSDLQVQSLDDEITEYTIILEQQIKNELVQEIDSNLKSSSFSNSHVRLEQINEVKHSLIHHSAQSDPQIDLIMGILFDEVLSNQRLTNLYHLYHLSLQYGKNTHRLQLPVINKEKIYSIMLSEIEESQNVQALQFIDERFKNYNYNVNKDFAQELKSKFSNEDTQVHLMIMKVDEPNLVYFYSTFKEQTLHIDKSKNIIIEVKNSKIFPSISYRYVNMKSQTFYLFDKEREILIDLFPNTELIEQNIVSSENILQKQLGEKLDFDLVKEILEEPIAINKCLYQESSIFGLRKGKVNFMTLEKAVDKLREATQIFIGACGSSYYASLYGKLLISELSNQAAVDVKIASEIEVQDFPNQDGMFLMISQSGETTDLLNIVPFAKEKGLLLIALTNMEGTSLGRLANCEILMGAGEEHSIASTKTFLSQVTLFALLSIWFSDKFMSEDYLRARLELCQHVSNLAAAVRELQCNCLTICESVASILKEKKHIFTLGSGFAHAIALEGSLKMKELTQIHCQAFSFENYKSNGMLNYLKNNKETPIIVVLPSQIPEIDLQNEIAFIKYAIENLTNYMVIITDLENDILSGKRKEEKFIWQIQVQSLGLLTALLCVVPIQLIAFEVAFQSGKNVDHPRSLTKVVI